MDSNTDTHSLKILMFPWLAHGHIAPNVEFAKRLVTRNFTIYICSTPVNLSFIKEQFDDQTFSKINLIELELPTLPDLPPHYHTTRNLPSHLIPTLIEALDSAKPHFLNLLKTIHPHCLVYDSFQPWAPAAASDLNIPAIYFAPFSAANLSYSHSRLLDSPENNAPFPFPTIQIQNLEYQKFGNQVFNMKAGGIKNSERFLLSTSRSSMIALRTSREIEGKFIDYFSVLTGKEVFPVGTLVHIQNRNKENQPNSIIEWLDSKPKASVVYVSFGSEYFMPKQGILELGKGLEISEVNFIWVVRFPKGEKEGKELEIEQVLPSGFLERVGERGMVVNGWADQEKILNHPSTGGFLTHCGWGSLLEGLTLGVPLIALPLQYEQPIHARLAVAEFGVAVEIESGDDGLFVSGEKVAKGIRMVMVEKEGELVRETAKKMKERLICRGEEEMDLFVEKVMELCSRNKVKNSCLS